MKFYIKSLLLLTLFLSFNSCAQDAERFNHANQNSPTSIGGEMNDFLLTKS